MRVNCICPGTVVVERTENLCAEDPQLVRTAQQRHLTRLGTPKDIAHCAVYLASNGSEYVTGAIFVTDGGWSVR